MDQKAKDFLDSHLLTLFQQIDIKKTESDIAIALGLEDTISSQSFFIKCGNRYETFWNFVIRNCTNATNLLIEGNEIILPNGDKRQIDLLFKIANKYYYYEMKCNLNFDSEKSPASISKILEVAECNKNKYNVSSKNFTYGYFNPVVRYVPQDIKDKAEMITIQHGVCDIVKIIGEENMPFTTDDYFEYHKTVLHDFAKQKLGL